VSAIDSRFIHRYWTGDAPLPTSSGFAGRTVRVHGVLRDWTDDTLPIDIREQMEVKASLVPEKARVKHRSNVVRLLLLQRFGGVWLDHDAIIIDMPDRREAWAAWAGERVASSIMYFPSKHPSLQVALDNIRPDTAAVKSSGEIMLTRVWTEHHLTYHPLPLDAAGRRDKDALPWAVHTWNSLEG
jgi:hypothetical protein